MKNTGKHLALWGTALTPCPLIGFVITAYGMIKAFSELAGESPQVEFLASHISTALYATLAGMVLAHIGGILLLIALYGAKYRAPWFKIVMWVFACLWVLFGVCMMSGSAMSSIVAIIEAIAGITAMVYLARHNREFAAQLAEPQPAGS